jgi:NAD(P)-dependent dehydrogenase (short-subunit alcohol dehydrogenase family)
LAAYYGLPTTPPAYAASKAALKVYGEALRPWLASYGIAASVILPGFVDTPMTDSLLCETPDKMRHNSQQWPFHPATLYS